MRIHNVFSALAEDIKTVFQKDPAARSLPEVLCCYPGLHALWIHRVSHHLWRHHLKLPGRMLSQAARFLTGIEIHPGARIGRRFFIDHGSGIVIGETAEIGDDVLMYQGVSLAGTSLEKKKRHPTIGNRVVIGAGAIVLGAITIGDDVRIGSGSVVVKSVPPGATVVGVPGRVVSEGYQIMTALDHGKLPDPVAEALRSVVHAQEGLADRVARLESAAGMGAGDEEKEGTTGPARDAGGGEGT